MIIQFMLFAVGFFGAGVAFMGRRPGVMLFGVAVSVWCLLGPYALVRLVGDESVRALTAVMGTMTIAALFYTVALHNGYLTPLGSRRRWKKIEQRYSSRER